MLIDLEAFARTPRGDVPFEHMVVEGFLDPTKQAALLADYPQIERPGSFPLAAVSPGPSMQHLIEEMQSGSFRQAVEQKFALDLSSAQTMVTLRGQCAARDGAIHTDSKKKIISVLLYLNPSWADAGGRLRLLRNSYDLSNFAVEIKPEFGVLLVFRRSERSWHGHESYCGTRKVIQLNWVSSARFAAWEQFRHRLSAFAKHGADATAVPIRRRLALPGQRL